MNLIIFIAIPKKPINLASHTPTRFAQEDYIATIRAFDPLVVRVDALAIGFVVAAAIGNVTLRIGEYAAALLAFLFHINQFLLVTIII